MGLSVGIVGLPNVGKSTLFNALTRTQNAAAANYPFCTIEPNKAIVPLRDERLDKISAIAKSKRTIEATVDFIDIAGLVRGASKGEGLGNKFLANIREADAVLYVTRCFEDDDVVHVEGGLDPLRDVELIQTELILADLQSLEKRMDRIGRQARAEKELRKEAEAMEALAKHLGAGLPARSFPRAENDGLDACMVELQLLTAKPVIYCANVGEDDFNNPGIEKIRAFAGREGASVVVVCAKMEAELAGLGDAERGEFLASYGLNESSLDQVIHTAYRTLGLCSYFTAGPMESRAWTIHKGWAAPRAAGVIHTDFERGFIRAEVITCEDFIAHGGEAHCRALGLLRTEGKEYLVQDGDVVHFLFNV